MSTHREIMADYYRDIEARSRVLGRSMMTIVAEDDPAEERTMTKMERRRLFALRLSNLLVMADSLKIPVAIFAYYRTAEEQHKCFLEKKSQCDGYIKRPKHQDWLAADLGILNADGTDFLWDDPRYAKLGELASKLGLTWGGAWSFNDVYHFELWEDR